MRKNIFYVLLALMTVCACRGFGDPIGLNIAGNDAADRLTGETADGCSVWTDVYGSDENVISSGTGLVMDGTGGLVTVDWASSNLWQHGPNGTSDQQIYHKWLDDSNPIVVSFNGLSDWVAASGDGGAYTIRIYQNTDWGDNTFPYIDITDGVTILETMQAPAENYDRSDGARAFVDSGILTADSIVLQLRERDLGARERSTFSAAKITLIDKFRPVNPGPEVGLEVPPSQVLSWEQLSLASGSGVTYDVYFGTDANELSPNYYYGLGPVKTTTDNPADFFYDPTLTNSETYYWRVVAIDPNNGHPTPHVGPEWWFTTQPATPVIQVDPASQTVAFGATEVTLSVAGINIESYQWYKDGAPLADDPTDTLYVGEDTATLTIYDVQVADEGDYYCVVDDGGSQFATSNTAQLITQRQIGWWKMDGDLTDSIDELYPDAQVHDGSATEPNFVAGVDGSAVKLENLDDVVTCVGSSDFFNSFVRGYAVSVWVKMPFKNGPWEAMVSMEGIHSDESRSGYIMGINGLGTAIHTLRESFNDLNANRDLDTDTWRLFIGTYDGTVGRTYVDGVLTNETTNTNVVNPSPADLLFGAQNADSTTVYNGLLDDIRIYSYAIDAFEAAALYTDLTPEVEICVENPDFDVAGPDGVGSEYVDCKVNLYDFAVFAQEWLECNVVPASACN